jgi:DNA sulfur modification protein DndB
MKELRVPALKIKQGPERELFSFSVKGKDIESIAAISRVKRHENELVGYQRPEVSNHIKEIKRYLESNNPMIPNALVIAFDDRVKFELASPENTEFGYLIIPIASDDEEKPGWVVDGQQRAAALRDAEIGDFQMPVSAFITNDAQEQREQFILVNSTKPLPKGLIYELLPYTETKLSLSLQKKRFPAKLLDKLNHGEDSPMKGMIKTATNPDGMIKDNSILKLIESSLSEGALYRFRDPSTGLGDADKIVDLLCNFWEAVADVFPDAWGVNPKKSRLMHGAGITALGHLMDAISERYHTEEREEITSYTHFKADLLELSEYCKWTNGYWDFGTDQKVKWNELQNISKDIQILTNYLLKKYRTEVWS